MKDNKLGFTAEDIRNFQKAAYSGPSTSEPNNVDKAIELAVYTCYETATKGSDSENTIITANEIIEHIGLDPKTTPLSTMESILLDMADGLIERGFRVRYMFDIRDISEMIDAPIRIYWADATVSQTHMHSKTSTIETDTNINIKALSDTIQQLNDKLTLVDDVNEKLNKVIDAVNNLDKSKDLTAMIKSVNDVKKSVDKVSDKATTNEYLIRGLDCY